ncbi:MAG: hypothetical protein ABI068_13390 [Ktedonobacterales bacterium]
MNTHERLIRERFARQRCATCGTLLTPESVLVLARRSNAWLLMVTCASCQHRGIYVASFPTSTTKPLNFSHITISPAPTTTSAPNHYHTDPLDTTDVLDTRDRADSLDASHTSSHASPLGAPPHSPHATHPITSNDVTDMRDFLTTFNGDFQRIFAHSRQQRHDPPSATD